MPDTEDKTWTHFTDRKNALLKSNLYKQILESVDNLEGVTRIRCLGLGTVTSTLPMFQLALLTLLVEHLEKEDTKLEVSVWDPVFEDSDVAFIEEKLHYKVVEDDKHDKEQQSSTLFYMPHFPISTLEDFITHKKPEYVLSNDLTVYNDKFTDSKFFELYPNSARLAKLISQDTTKTETAPVPAHEFQVVTKKNRKKKNPIKYTPPVVEYDFDSAFFKSVKSTKITEGNDLSNPWDSAFTDLSFYIISK